MINLPNTFFEDEVREGFYIPSAVKKAWGAELMVLSAIDELCQKYGIKYYAEWGTFLGAVRHGGFIPWDDDMDIGMLRDDYEKFLEHADELPKGFKVYNLRSRESHDQFLANVVNLDRICFEPEHLETYHGFPYIACVDIFITDYVSKDKNAFYEMISDAKMVLGVSDSIKDGTLKGKDIEIALSRIESKFGKKISIEKDLNKTAHKLDILAESIFMRFSHDEADEVSQIMPWGLQHDRRHPIGWYDELVKLPFEGIEVPVPCDYVEALTSRYGDFMTLYKNAGAHNYPYFLGQRDNLKKVLDFELPEYSFDKLSQNKELIDTTNSYKATVDECLEAIKRTYKNVSELLNGIHSGDVSSNYIDSSMKDTVLDNLANMQNLAIDLGNFMEGVKGEGYDIVSLVEKLCEKIYNLYTHIDSNWIGFDDDIAGFAEQASIAEILNDEKQLNNDLGTAIDNLIDTVNRRKEYIFMPFKASYMNSFGTEYENACKDEDIDVYVVPMPYYFKNYAGVLKDMQYDLSSYQSVALAANGLVHCDEFDFELHFPDRIYTQYPYDNENEVTGIPPFLHSDNIRKYTNELVYMPWFKTSPFNTENQREYKNMMYYALMPGVVNADKVILSSEGERTNYVSKLTEWAGGDTKAIWESKVQVLEEIDSNPETDSQEDNTTSLCAQGEKKNKMMVFFISLSLLVTGDERAIEKLRNVIETFEENKDKLDILWVRNDEEKILKEINPSMYDKYIALIENFETRGIGHSTFEKCEKLVEMADAFYGDPGVLAHEFRNAKKPVMIMNYDI